MIKNVIQSGTQIKPDVFFSTKMEGSTNSARESAPLSFLLLLHYCTAGFTFHFVSSS